MSISPFARLYSGAAYHEEDRGDAVVGAGGGGAEDVTEVVVDKEKVDAEAKVAAEAEAKRVAEKAEREKGITIPKDRFDAGMKKERDAKEAAEKRAAEAEAKLAKQAAGVDAKKLQEEIAALDEQLDKALADNDVEAKKRLRAAIREKDQALSRAEARELAAQGTAIAVEQIRYDRVVDDMETAYPFLVAEGETFNEAITGELLELKGAFEASGMSSSESLKKAARILAPALKEAKAALEKGDKDAEAVAEESARKAKEEAEAKAKAAGGDAAAKSKAEEEAKARREAAVKKGLEAKELLPASKPGTAGKADKEIVDPKASKMSDKDFDALPEAELKRLRGD